MWTEEENVATKTEEIKLNYLKINNSNNNNAEKKKAFSSETKSTKY